MNLNGKVVLITGSSRGIGAAIAEAIATEGAFVAVNYLQNEDAAEKTVLRCKDNGGEAEAFRCDVRDSNSVKELIDKVLGEFGKIDILVNNAFGYYKFDPKNRQYFWNLEREHYQTQLDSILFSTFSLCKSVIPSMRERASGSIINIASNLVLRPTIPYHDYTTAKSALIGFSRNLAMELGPFGIRVNCVSPGLVYPTEASLNTSEEVKEIIVAQTPLKSIAKPEDITGPVLFLASEWSNFMTGQNLVVDGGLVMG